jgi:hypothetical protein
MTSFECCVKIAVFSGLGDRLRGAGHTGGTGEASGPLSGVGDIFRKTCSRPTMALRNVTIPRDGRGTKHEIVVVSLSTLAAAPVFASLALVLVSGIVAW